MGYSCKKRKTKCFAFLASTPRLFFIFTEQCFIPNVGDKLFCVVQSAISTGRCKWPKRRHLIVFIFFSCFLYSFFPSFASFIRRTSECGGKRDISFYNHSWWQRQSVFASVICLHLCCLEIIQFLLAFLFLACFAFTWQMLPTLSPRLKPFHLTGRRQLPSPPPHHPRKKNNFASGTFLECYWFVFILTAV